MTDTDISMHIGPLFKILNENLEKNLNQSLHEHGLTSSQVRLMAILTGMEGGKATLKQLESEMHTSQPTIVGIVCRLEMKGMIESFVPASDRRVKCVRITDWGRSAVNQSMHKLLALEKRYLSALTEEEQETLLALLRKMYENLT